MFSVPNEKNNGNNVDQDKSRISDFPIDLSTALGNLVKNLSDAWIPNNNERKEINRFIRFYIATSGTFVFTFLCYMVGVTNYFFGESRNYPILTLLIEDLLITSMVIGIFSAYFGFLISSSKSYFSYVRLFLAGVFLPAIVFALVFAIIPSDMS